MGELVVRKARLLEIKKEIAWIGCELNKLKNQWKTQQELMSIEIHTRTGPIRNYSKEKHPTGGEKIQIAIWYDYLNELMTELRDMKDIISDDYKFLVNELKYYLERDAFENFVINNKSEKLL